MKKKIIKQDNPSILPNPSIKALATYTDAINSYTNKQLKAFSKAMQWGTYGPNGSNPMKIKHLCDLDTDHIENILVTQSHVNPIMRKVLLYLLKQRIKADFMSVF